MKRLLIAFVFFPAFVAAFGENPPKVHVTQYEIQIEIDPENHAMKGSAEIQLQIFDSVRSIPFEMNSRLTVSETADRSGRQLNIKLDENNSNRLWVSSDTAFPRGDHTIQIQYEGELERESYSFLDKSRIMNGYIDTQVACLMFSSRWFPVHDPLFDQATAQVSVTVPLGFTALVAGIPEPVKTSGLTETFQWNLSRPSNQLSLVIGRLREYKFAADEIPVHIFLGEGLESRAEAIFRQISGMLGFFQRSLAPYPFGHLTLVGIPDDVRDEMAGPGMLYLPDALLKRPQIPDIELARRLALQWWGLGVMPATPQDMMLADGFAFYQAAQYLESENKDAYRDEILKLSVLALKYESHSSISNAYHLGFRGEEYESIVGGKGAWVLHMLEDILGRDEVASTLSQFVAAHMGKQASLSQFESEAAAASGQDLKWFFTEWIETTGIPELEVDYTVFKLADGSFRVAGAIKQNLELFRMPLRIAVETKEKLETQAVQVSGKTSKFEIRTATRPIRVVLDPEQKLLRSSAEMEVAVHVALGYELFQKNQFLEAIREYERAIKLNPRSSLAHYRLGEVFFEQANTQSAGNSFRDALNGDLQPKWVEPTSHLQLGKIFDMLGERQRALAEYQKVINAKDNTFNAVEEAEKYSREPFTKKSTIMDKPDG
ncbi:MAG: tetratricopeptide repeat protein [Acidobacteria bacterium]|nr:tetratricopeptide repeat protein [Acidobacteriota bacterium]